MKNILRERGAIFIALSFSFLAIVLFLTDAEPIVFNGAILGAYFFFGFAIMLLMIKQIYAFWMSWFAITVIGGATLLWLVDFLTPLIYASLVAGGFLSWLLNRK